MDSLNDTRQNTFEWQETMPLSGIVLDPPGASPAQSTDDSLHNSQSSSMWSEDDFMNIDPRDLELFERYFQPQGETSSVAGERDEAPPNSLKDLQPRRKRRRAESSSTDNSGCTQQTELRRQRNRIAASKCRRKSKQKNDIMLERERELEQRHNALKSCVDSLKAEVLDLREEVLKHANCDNEPIQNHITQSIQTVMGQPSSVPKKTALHCA